MLARVLGCLTRAALLGGVPTAPSTARAELALLMVAQAGCVCCRLWNEEIGGRYPLTDVGRAAPLRRLDLRSGTPEGVTLDRPAVFTPTFVLLKDGGEVGRIEGYSGEAFFRGLLGGLLSQAQEP